MTDEEIKTAIDTYLRENHLERTAFNVMMALNDLGFISDGD